MKTLLIYDDLVPVTRKAHGDIFLERRATYEFARETNAVPLVTAEFPQVTQDHAIVFTETDEGVVPVVILGARKDENAYVTAEGRWDAPYVPAFVRRYPFVFGSDKASDTLTLMIDQKYPGLNEKCLGERLFETDGIHSPFLENTLAFLKEYQALFNQTRAFGTKLKELDLLEPVEAHMPLPKDPERRLAGFFIVNRNKLKALPADTLAELVRNDALELVFLHLASLRNLVRLQEKLTARTNA